MEDIRENQPISKHIKYYILQSTTHKKTAFEDLDVGVRNVNPKEE